MRTSTKLFITGVALGALALAVEAVKFRFINVLGAADAALHLVGRPPKKSWV